MSAFEDFDIGFCVENGERRLAGIPEPHRPADAEALRRLRMVLQLRPASPGGIRRTYWNAALEALWSAICQDPEGGDGMYAIDRQIIEKLKA